LRLIALIILLPFSIYGQNQLEVSKKLNTIDVDAKKISINDYLIINQERDTTHVDTTLNIKKYYKFNVQRKDNFNNISFNNSGQVKNELSFHNIDFKPGLDFGFSSKKSQRFHESDVKYYHLPTPLSEVFFKTTLSQGQSTDALISANIHPKLNYSIGYKGHRSIGKYQNQRVNLSQLRFSLRYENPNDRYRLRLQLVNQRNEQQENGGLTELSINDFQSGAEEFFDRNRLSVNYEDASNFFNEKRFLVEQDYLVKPKKDSLNESSVRIGYRFHRKIHDNKFSQNQAYDYYGPIAEKFTKPNDHFHYGFGQFDAYSIITNNKFGWLSPYIRHHKYLYQHIHDNEVSDIKVNSYSTGLTWKKKFKNADFKFSSEISLNSKKVGDEIFMITNYRLSNDSKLLLKLSYRNKHPGLTFEKFYSTYSNFNWTTETKMVKTFAYDINYYSSFLGKISFSQHSVINHPYFLETVEEELNITPLQSINRLNIFQMEWEKDIYFGVFGFNSRIKTQKVYGNESSVVPIPEFIGRTSVYYQDKWFKNAMFLQLGISAKYFSTFFMRNYNPIISEFVNQNNQLFGGFPLINAFFNAKIRQTRLFLIAEHINANKKSPRYFSAPGYPYRDFMVRFGLVWNFFK